MQTKVQRRAPLRMVSVGSHPMDRLFYALMVGMGVVSSSIILTALYMLTASLDSHVSENDSKRLAALLDEQTQSLMDATEVYAVNDALYDAVISRLDSASLQEIVPLSEGDSPFDWVAILDANGRVIYDLNLPRAWDAVTYFESHAYRTVLDQASDSRSSPPALVGGAFATSGHQFLATTTQIVPESLSGVDVGSLPYFIGGRNFDSETLQDIAVEIGSTNISIVPNSGEFSVPVQGPLGFVGYLTWQADLPGLQFRQLALPWVLTICAVVVFLSAWTAAYFRKLVNSLERMRKVATTDHLTGVANRAALTLTLQSATVQKALRDGTCAAISLDLDDFKKLNDEFGHGAGDIALKVSADHIAASLRRSDKVFRMGGDEFLCLIFDPDPKAAAQKVVDRLKAAFGAPMYLGNISQTVTPSIGVAIAGSDEDWDAVLARSDAAMYRAKRSDHTFSIC